MLRLALLLIVSSIIFGLATFGPVAFLLVVCGLAAWAFWRSRRESHGPSLRPDPPRHAGHEGGRQE